MKDASTYGFSPGASAGENARALQAAIEGGGTVCVDAPGRYDICGTVKIPSDTSIFFGAGVYVRREDGDSGGYLFVNEGAYTRRMDSHIRLEGLKLICNGVNVSLRPIPGLAGHLSFFYVKDLVIRDIECLDLPPHGFCIHVCTFEDVVIEHVRIEGEKDAVHLGRGKRFTIRDGVFRTFDDPIALNAHDYATSNPQLGWIEDGLIENCYDLDDERTTGFFCRILAGSWVDWYEGMRVQHSDTVASEGRLYRVIMRPDGEVYTSRTRPAHAHGTRTMDGIDWVMVQEDVIYNCGCRNVVFRDIFLKKRRPVAFSIHFDCDGWSRSYYPGSIPPVQANLLFDHIIMDAPIDVLISSHTPVDAVQVRNSRLLNTAVQLKHAHAPGASFDETQVLLSGNTFADDGRRPLVEASEGRRARLKVEGSLVLDPHYGTCVSAGVNVAACDIPLSLTPCGGQKEGAR